MRSKGSSRIRGTTQKVERVARELRREMTPAEKKLWNALRKQRLADLRFRRQHPVGRFVLDFYCPATKLGIEVDGGVHDEQIERDRVRTMALESAGYTVLRFRNDEVLNDLPSVLRRIEGAARQPPTSPR